MFINAHAIARYRLRQNLNPIFKDIMSTDVEVIRPDSNVTEAAKKMRSLGRWKR